MATIIAQSVPGMMGIHWSEKTAAVSVYLGSTVTILAPFSLAWARYQLELVWATVFAGSLAHRIIKRELRMSSRPLPSRAPNVASSP